MTAAAAKRFGKEGFIVLVNGIQEKNGVSAEKELQDLGFEAYYIKADVTREEEVNAMIAHRNAVMDLNLTSAFYVSRAAIPHLKKNGGSIVNITSIAAHMGGGPGATAYAVTKAGLLTFTRGLAKELIPYGIRVNAVSPGTIDTDFHSETNRDLLDSWVKGIPAGRLGKPEDIANAIYFVASEEASYLVGEVIQVNGGQDFR